MSFDFIIIFAGKLRVSNEKVKTSGWSAKLHKKCTFLWFELESHDEVQRLVLHIHEVVIELAHSCSTESSIVDPSGHSSTHHHNISGSIRKCYYRIKCHLNINKHKS